MHSYPFILLPLSEVLSRCVSAQGHGISELEGALGKPGVGVELPQFLQAWS